MDKIYEPLHIPSYQSRIFDLYFSEAKIAFFDIETTGLSPDYAKTILGGLLRPASSGAEVFQYFASDLHEEPQLLAAYLQALSQADLLISFNGNRFDLPFLNRRAQAENLAPLPPFYTSLDLYRCCRFYSSLPQILPNLKQKTVERFLGIAPERTDEISGAESITLYREYQKTKDDALRSAVLLHNRDDLVQLSRLLGIFNRLDLHRILFYEGFPVLSKKRGFYLRAIRFQNSALTLTATAKNCPMDYNSFENGYQASYRAAETVLTMKFPCFEQASCLFVDLESIPCDFQALEAYPGFQSGYLILKNKDRIQYAETNLFLKLVLQSLLQKL